MAIIRTRKVVAKATDSHAFTLGEDMGGEDAVDIMDSSGKIVGGFSRYWDDAYGGDDDSPTSVRFYALFGPESIPEYAEYHLMVSNLMTWATTIGLGDEVGIALRTKNREYEEREDFYEGVDHCSYTSYEPLRDIRGRFMRNPVFI